jgi:pimeloyl-ACP methyl ester carboxylesterase
VAHVRVVSVTFAVTNANTSDVPCPTDGRGYSIHGQLFLPPSLTPNGVTLYVHGLGFSSYFWHFTSVPGYDYATLLAQQGHASVIVDRLGYGGSSVPAGSASCVGGQASIAHQVVQALRTGQYVATGQTAHRFSRVGLAGHSLGGELVEIEAHSFHDIDALAVVDWADQGYSPLALGAFGALGAQCVTGGVAEGPGQAGGYGSYGETVAQYDALMFHDADPAVVAAANALRTKDPCGDVESILTAVAIDLAKIGTINVPIAYVWGDDDANYVPAIWWQLQEPLYAGSPKVTGIGLSGTGHAVTLERSASTFRAGMAAWLTQSGL